MSDENPIRAYLIRVQALLGEVEEAKVERLVQALLQAWRKGKKVLLFGNGGSHATVSHMACDFQKNVLLETGRPLKTLCLGDPVPLVMAWANDTDWSNIFAPQVETWAEPGDVVIGVSGSGNSANVLNGIRAARHKEALTFGLCGFGGGSLAEIAEVALITRSTSMQHVEDVHSITLHAAFAVLLERAKQEGLGIGD